jgi:hypothetical protein
MTLTVDDVITADVPPEDKKVAHPTGSARI